MRRRPLPADLGSAFTVRDARRLDVPRDRLSARDLSAPFHGVSTLRRQNISVREMCEVYAPRPTSAQFFSHHTAGVLWGMPLPVPQPDRLHVSAMAPAREPRTSGVIGHRVTISAEACARLHRRGARDLAPALASIRLGAESPRESKVRRILMRAGLPEPELNWTLRDARGNFVARLDMAYPDHRVAVEYDGRQHADVHQFRRDADRWPAIAGQGWLLVRVVDHHLRDPERFIVAPTVTALRSRGWRP